MQISQSEFFSVPSGAPDGFTYQPDFISEAEEQQLLRAIDTLEFAEVRMHGIVAKRLVVHFGRSYEFQTFKLGPAPDAPGFLQPLRKRVGGLTGHNPAEFAEVLVTEYPPGAGIGWHRDAPAFDVVVGVSLLGRCAMQFRPWPVKKAGSASGGRRSKPVAQVLAPRSAYILQGPARNQWQHHIPPTKTLRYSITFRTLRKGTSTK